MGKLNGTTKGSRTGRYQGCNLVERVGIERFLAAGASIKGAARKFAIDYHSLRRHWRNHVSAEARVGYIAGAGATKDQLEEIVADESLGLPFVCGILCFEWQTYGTKLWCGR